MLNRLGVSFNELRIALQVLRTMSTYDSLLADAARLPIGERVQLIEALWETVPEDALPGLSAEWLDEIKRRSAEYDAGLVQPIPWETIRSDAKRRGAKE
jgi:putative addiction module component (TIGR02574 family)